MTTNTYNGWTNYATWRVNLEMLDELSLSDLFYDADTDTNDAYDVGQELRAYVEGFVDNECTNTYISGWVYAFLADVNWTEIAQHKLDEEKEAA